MEEILGTEILDETDLSEDQRSSLILNQHIEQQQQFELYQSSRDVDLARLRTMRSDGVLQEEVLSEEEIQSIGIYLFTNVPQIQRKYRDDLKELHALIRRSPVITMDRVTPSNSSSASSSSSTTTKASQEDYLYRRGKMSTACTLILSGAVEVQHGNSNYNNNDSDNNSSTSAVLLDGTTEPATLQDATTTTTTTTTLTTKGPWSTIAVEALMQPEGTYIPDFCVRIASPSVRFLRMTNFVPTLAPTNSGAIGADNGQHKQYQRKLGHALDLLPFRRAKTNIGANVRSLSSTGEPTKYSGQTAAAWDSKKAKYLTYGAKGRSQTNMGSANYWNNQQFQQQQQQQDSKSSLDRGSGGDSETLQTSGAKLKSALKNAFNTTSSSGGCARTNDDDSLRSPLLADDQQQS